MAIRRKLRAMPMTKARATLGAVVRRLRSEPDMIVVLERRGQAVAALMSIDELEDLLDLSDPELQAQIRQGAKDYRAGRYRATEELLEEMGGKEKRPSPPSRRLRRK